MSKQYPGGIISKTAPVPSGPYSDSTAPGIWTLEQQAALVKQGNWPTAGNVNPNAFIENLFSTFVYTGTGANQVITNGINLSTYGGLVWAKNRVTALGHYLIDTVRGGTEILQTNNTNANSTVSPSYLTAQTTGYQTGPADGGWNGSTQSLVSWTFREQPKFFDIVTWTGNGTGDREISHSLGSAPGCIFLKNTSNGGTSWFVYHGALSTPNFRYMYLQDTAAALTSGDNLWNVTSTTFRASSVLDANNNGQTYIAYLFAHNAGGFGLTGADNVISCGTWTNNGSGNASVTLGYEPQWILWKRSDSTSDWYIFDTMRGWTGDPNNSSAGLRPNTSNTENSLSGYAINSTGFSVAGGVASATYIYIAIRRGPMAVPTVGTSVFSPIAYTGNSTSNTTVQNLTTSFSGDAVIIQQRTAGNRPLVFDKLRGKTQSLYTSATTAEEDINAFRAGQSVGFNNTQTVLTGQFTSNGNYNYSGDTFIGWNFKRAPSFFDEVCYTGTGSATTQTHNLGVVPELMIVKTRAGTYTRGWAVYTSALGNTKAMLLDMTLAAFVQDMWNNTTPTASVFSVSADNYTNNSATTYVAYLFATCAGVSKVGSYTGNGTTQTINCGFTGGARFVLIKRTDSTGDWMVSDSARGIVSGNDPYLELNNTNAEVTGEDWLDTDSTGFVVNEVSGSNANTSSATYIFLAIA